MTGFDRLEDRDRPWLGIIGGCGPRASTYIQSVIQERTPVTIEQDHVPILSCVDSTMPSRVMAINSGDQLETVQNHFVENAKYLDERCEYLVIGSNTSHYFYDIVDSATDAELLHIPELALERLDSLDYNTVYVFGTNTLADEEIYCRSSVDIDVVHPDPDRVTELIFELKDGASKKTVRSEWKAWLNTIDTDGAFLSACTELSMISFDDVVMYDAVSIFADVIIGKIEQTEVSV